MFFVFIVFNIILTVIFFIYNSYILGLSAGSNIMQSILFLFTSIIVSWGVDKLWNPDPVGEIAKKPKNKHHKTKPAPSLIDIFEDDQDDMADKVLSFSKLVGGLSYQNLGQRIISGGKKIILTGR